LLGTNSFETKSPRVASSMEETACHFREVEGRGGEKDWRRRPAIFGRWRGGGGEQDWCVGAYGGLEVEGREVEGREVRDGRDGREVRDRSVWVLTAGLT
jgi:hypothetical protein